MTVSAHALSPIAFAVLLATGAAAFADDEVVYLQDSARAESRAEMRAKRAYENPMPAPDTSNVTASTEGPTGTPGVMTRRGPREVVSGRAFGSFGIPYTTGRVQTGNQSAAGVTSSNLLSATYPYRAIGKLTFNAGYCSASLIRRSVLVTAAHCTQAFGGGSSLFSNFRFTPGHYGAAGATAQQIAPHGTWSVATLVRPATWASGTDIGSGAARDNDIAVMILNKNANGQFVGDITGWMAYGWNNYSFTSSSKTGNLQTAAISTLGYPALMDSGAIMQRTDGPTYTTTIGGAGQLWQGSNLTGGSSGGPWVVNFRARSAALSGGAAEGTASVMAVVGVTSWGSADPNSIKDNYSSQFRQNSRYPNAAYGVYGAGNIASLINTVCTAAAPGGGTYASQGYCN